MKITFELITATSLQTFNEITNDRLAKGYKFLAGQTVNIAPHETINGPGYLYSVPMLKEEQEDVENA